MNKMLIFLFLFASVFQGFAQDYRTHKVESGDTVYKLAKEYNTTEEAIYVLNPGSKESIRLGQILVIPPKKIGESTKVPLRFKNYIVKPKETIFGISQQNGINTNELKKFNPYLYKEELGMGDTIKIPVFTKGNPKPINYNKSIQNSSFGNLLHVVLPGETLYGIAREYGIRVDRLRELNSNMKTLKPGDVLVVSRKEKSAEIPAPIINEDKFTYYEVKQFDEGSPETIYSLTRKFDISRDSLFALNPFLKKEGLQQGMKLKVPILEKNISKATIGREIIDLEKEIINYEPLKIAVLLPFQLNSFETDSIVQQREQLKQNRLARIAFDFYGGVLLALEKAKSLGVSVDLHTFDTEQNQLKILEILRENDFSQTQAVIGPLLGNLIEVTAQKLSNENVPVFSPLTKMEIMGSENLYQTRPTDDQLRIAMINYLDSIHQNQHVLIVTDSKNSEVGNILRQQFPGALSLSISGEYAKMDAFLPKLKKKVPNWIIFEAENIPLIGSALAHLNSLVAQGYDIRLFTTNRNDSYESDEISNLNLSRLKFTFPAFTKEPDLNEHTDFLEAYQSRYGIKPNKFAVRGYDLTYDVLLRLASSKNIEASLKNNWTTEYVENKFHYIEKKKDGYLNTAVYILQLQENMTTKPVQL
ncbi:MAG TPA: LysM peptidoglycan-binding domain-containing protein [Flavobacteriaceae bacterium]|nr:LysM peptidoglycan-binding domain-containing protein [Flavobacteriaceae bacterium]